MARFPAGNTNLLTLLKESRTVYIIPKYQRSYAWEEQPWLTDFWDDIYETVYKRGEELFTGTIILCETDVDLLSDANRNLYYKDVIDGQQRLTTLLILLRALYDSFSDSRRAWAKSNIYTPYFLAEANGENRLRLSQEDQKFFDDFILDVENLGAPPRRQKASEKRLAKALAFFKNKIQENGSGEPDGFAEEFFNKLKDNLAVVLIEARSDVDAYVIFETINSKNRPLTPSELLKNYFYSVASQSQAVLKKTTANWDGITDELGQKDIDITEYIRHFWISTRQGKVSEKRLYRSIKDEMKREQSKVETFVNELKKEAATYAEIANPLESSKGELEKYLLQLKDLGIKQCYPLILSLQAIGYPEIPSILKEIISISLRRSVSDRNPNELEMLYSKYSYLIRNEGNTKVEEFITDLRGFDIDDDQFINALISAKLSPKIGKFMLMRLEEMTRTGETRLHPQDVEIEHIMPGIPERLEDWCESSEVHKEWVETLGNKTLIGPTFNKKMSNKSFTVKRPSYESSEINLAKQLAKSYTAWSVDVIKERTKVLAANLIKLYT